MNKKENVFQHTLAEKNALKALKVEHKITQHHYGQQQGAIRTTLKFKDSNWKVRG